MTFKLSNFKQKKFTPKSSQTTRTFPMRILAAGKISVDGAMIDALEGEDLSRNNEKVIVCLRPYEGNRPEIVDFVTDRVKELVEAAKTEDLDLREKIATNPANHVYTEFGGVILVENAIYNEKTQCYEAGWLRTLIRKAADEATGISSIESPVWARINPVSSRDGLIRASLDVIYPNLITLSLNSADDLDYQIKSQLDNVSMKGQRFAVIVLKTDDETVVNTIFSRAISERTENGKDSTRYVTLSSDALLKDFWNQFPEESVKDLRSRIGSSVSAAVIPGVRYYYLTDTDKGVAVQEPKLVRLSKKFEVDAEGEIGFLPCAVALRMHTDNQSMYPMRDGLWPIVRNLTPVATADILSYQIEKDGSYKAID